MMKPFSVLIALGAALAFVPAAAAAPTITRLAAETNSRISVEWTLGPGEQTWTVEVARSQATDSDGNFTNDLAGYNVGSQPTQTSWTSKLPFNPGTYYVHVGSTNFSVSADTLWSGVSTVNVAYPLHSRWFDLRVPSSGRDHAQLFFDADACDTMNAVGPTIPAAITIRSSWRKQPARLRAQSVCSMGDLAYRRYFGGYITGSEKYVAWNLFPSRSFSVDGTWTERLTITGYTLGHKVGRHVLAVRYHNEVPKTIWEGTDAFVNYCIDRSRPIHSKGGRLYCTTTGAYSVKLTRIR